jgi:hypothetical protein
VRRTALVPLALAAWTVFIWGTRIRNIVRDGGSALALVLAVGMVVLAGVVAAAVWRGGRPAWAVPALALATIATWAVRIPLILLADHPVGFTVVHAVLGLTSIALAGLAWRQHEAIAAGARRVPASSRP